MLVTIDATYGATLIGCEFAAVFYGITCVQTCRYYILFRDDSRCLKWTVGILWFLDTLHLASVISSMYFFLVVNRAVLEPGPSPFWTDSAMIITSNLSDFLVRCVFLYRIWLLSERCLPLVAMLGSIVAIAAGFGIFYGALDTTLAPGNTAYTLMWPIYPGLASSAVADFAICAIMCTFFYRLRSSVDTCTALVNKLILYAIYAAALPSAIALSSLVMFVVASNTFIYIGIFFVLSKATLNSMLAMLNARKNLRQVLPLAKQNMIQREIDGLGRTFEASHASV